MVAFSIPDAGALVQPLADRFGLSVLPLHAGTVVKSLAFWVSLQLLSSHLSPRLFPTIYPQLKRSTRISWDVHFVALVHAALITPLCAKVWWDVYSDPMHPMAQRRIYGYTYEAGTVYAIAIGYFIWDSVVSILVRARHAYAREKPR